MLLVAQLVENYLVGLVVGSRKSKIGSHFVNFQIHAKRLHRFQRETFGASELESQLLGCSTRKVMTFPSKGYWPFWPRDEPGLWKIMSNQVYNYLIQESLAPRVAPRGILRTPY